MTEDEDQAKVSFAAQLVRGKRDRRVTAVQFVTDGTELRLVCGGEEGSVQIWDVATLTMIEQHRKHKAEVTAVTVSGALDANFVVAGDRQGRISVWERDAGKVSIFTPVTGDGVHSIAMSPHDKSLVAVGYRSGVLCLVDVMQGVIRHKLEGHEQEVQCVAWKPADPTRAVVNDVETNEKDDVMWLASSSRDKTIKMWSIRVDAAVKPDLDRVLRLPTSKQGMAFSQTKQLWLPVAWNRRDQTSTDKFSLWSGSFDGSLLLWEWSNSNAGDSVKPANSNRRCKPVVVKGGHSRMLFAIVMAPPHESIGSEAVSMLTVSLDRELRLWKTEMGSKASSKARCVETLAGLGGHAYSVSYSSSNSAVAVGVGDQTIRLWQFGNKSDDPDKSDYECDLLWKGLQSKVTSVCWHPFQRSTLAYGTEDGRIGLYDTQTKKYSHFRTSHDREVEQLEWRIEKPKADTSGNRDSVSSAFLESVKQLEVAQAHGDNLEDALTTQENQAGKKSDNEELKVYLWSRDSGGQLLESNSDMVDQKSRVIMSDAVAFSWDTKYELVAIGRSNGVVEVLNQGVKNENGVQVVHRYHEHLEAVTCLSWSAGNLIASGGQDGKIFICGYVITPSSELDDSISDCQTEKNHVLGSLVGHSGKITCLRWFPDSSKGLLASSSADGTVQVWNTQAMDREAHFGWHVGRVLSVDWISPSTLVTGGEDQTLRVWNYGDQPNTPIVKQRQLVKAKQPQQVEILAQKQNVVLEDPTVSSGASPSEGAREAKASKPKKRKTLIFHPENKLSPTEIASVCQGIAGTKTECSGKEIDTNCILGMHDRGAVRNFFNSETEGFKAESDWESAANVLLLQGKISEALRLVSKQGVLTATWVSYAPMAGLDVWREITNLYAQQLDAQGDKKAAAFHFLSIAKVRSAIKCLVDGNAFQEALALIRARLGPNDPLLEDTLWKYAEFLSKRGRPGEAALALLNINSVKATSQAVRKLVSTGDMISIRSALDVLVATTRPISVTVEREVNGMAELYFPSGFFISIAGRAILMSDFEAAVTTAKLLQTRLVSSKPSASHRLMGCLIELLEVIEDVRLHKYIHSPDAVSAQVEDYLEVDAPASVKELFEFLVRSKQAVGSDANAFYERLSVQHCKHDSTDRQEQPLDKTWLVARADQFWYRVLGVCRSYGYWFDTDGEACVQDAQHLLVETSCFEELEKAIAAASNEDGARDLTLVKLRATENVLRFLMEVMSLSFVGALEQIRDTLLLVQSEGGSTDIVSSETTSTSIAVDVLTLFCPCGFISPKQLPQCGELKDEGMDTLILWSSVLLSQCMVMLSTFAADAGQTVQLLDSLLSLLCNSFISDETLSPGLMDSKNQSQLEALLNEMLVLAYQLPGELSPRHEDNKDSCTAAERELDQDHVRESKQRVIACVNDAQSRLAWSGE